MPYKYPKVSNQLFNLLCSSSTHRKMWQHPVKPKVPSDTIISEFHADLCSNSSGSKNIFESLKLNRKTLLIHTQNTQYNIPDSIRIRKTLFTAPFKLSFSKYRWGKRRYCLTKYLVKVPILYKTRYTKLCMQ